MSKLNRNQKAMLFAQGIVERYRARGNQLPHRSKTCRMDPNRAQEYKDAAKLNDWKQSLKGNRGTCSPEIRNYLDLHIAYWRTSRGGRNTSDNGSTRDSDEENSNVCQSQVTKKQIPGTKKTQSKSKSKLQSKSQSRDKHSTMCTTSTLPLSDHNATNIEAEVCYAMVSKFSPQQSQQSQQSQQQLSPLSELNKSKSKDTDDNNNHNIDHINHHIRKRYDVSNSSSHHHNTEKREDDDMHAHKRQRIDSHSLSFPHPAPTPTPTATAMELNEEINRQIRLDSELLLHFMYSGRGEGGTQSIRSC